MNIRVHKLLFPFPNKKKQGALTVKTTRTMEQIQCIKSNQATNERSNENRKDEETEKCVEDETSENKDKCEEKKEDRNIHKKNKLTTASSEYEHNILTRNERFFHYYTKQNILKEAEVDFFMEKINVELPITFRLLRNNKFSSYICESIESKLKSICKDKYSIIHLSKEDKIYQINLTRYEIKKNKNYKDLYDYLINLNESGYIFRQELVSMLPVLFLELNPNFFVLDICAAPGSKTAQILDYMHMINRRKLKNLLIHRFIKNNAICIPQTLKSPDKISPLNHKEQMDSYNNLDVGSLSDTTCGSCSDRDGNNYINHICDNNMFHGHMEERKEGEWNARKKCEKERNKLNIESKELFLKINQIFNDNMYEDPFFEYILNKDKESFEMYKKYISNNNPSGVVIANDSNFKRCCMLFHRLKNIYSDSLIVTNNDAVTFPYIYIKKDMPCVQHENEEVTQKEKHVREDMKKQSNGNPEENKYPDQQDVQAMREQEDPYKIHMSCLQRERGMMYERKYFDSVLCDVPCSSDGTVRKDKNAWLRWSEINAYNLFQMQVNILKRSIDLTKINGNIIYSTCSLNPIENEAVLCEVFSQLENKNALKLINFENMLLQQINYKSAVTNWKLFLDDMWFDTYEQFLEYLKGVASASTTNINNIRNKSRNENNSGNNDIPNENNNDRNNDNNNGSDSDDKNDDHVVDTVETGNTSRINYKKRKLYEKIKRGMFPPSEEFMKSINLYFAKRFYPHLYDAGGFFIAVIKKCDIVQWKHGRKYENSESKLLMKNMNKNEEDYMRKEKINVNQEETEQNITVQQVSVINGEVKTNDKRYEREIKKQNKNKIRRKNGKARKNRLRNENKLDETRSNETHALNEILQTQEKDANIVEIDKEKLNGLRSDNVIHKNTICIEESNNSDDIRELVYNKIIIGKDILQKQDEYVSLNYCETMLKKNNNILATIKDFFDLNENFLLIRDNLYIHLKDNLTCTDVSANKRLNENIKKITLVSDGVKHILEGYTKVKLKIVNVGTTVIQIDKNKNLKNIEENYYRINYSGCLNFISYFNEVNQFLLDKTYRQNIMKTFFEPVYENEKRWFNLDKYMERLNEDRKCAISKTYAAKKEAESKKNDMINGNILKEENENQRERCNKNNKFIDFTNTSNNLHTIWVMSHTILDLIKVDKSKINNISYDTVKETEKLQPYSPNVLLTLNKNKQVIVIPSNKGKMYVDISVEKHSIIMLPYVLS